MVCERSNKEAILLPFASQVSNKVRNTAFNNGCKTRGTVSHVKFPVFLGSQREPRSIRVDERAMLELNVFSSRCITLQTHLVTRLWNIMRQRD